MKEQVSVDSAGAYFSWEQINLIRQWFNSLEDVHPTYLQGQDYKVYAKIQNLLGNKLRPCQQEIIEEYERLKRLAENVKKKIELIKSTIEKNKNSGIGEFYIDKAILATLESLDNTDKE
jgi:hypothetical protein